MISDFTPPPIAARRGWRLKLPHLTDSDSLPTLSLPGLGPRWFMRKPSKKVAIVAGAVGIGLAAISERSAEAAHLLWEQGGAGSIPAAPNMIFTGP